MKAAGSERIRPGQGADEVTIDELMDALHRTSDQICAYSSGYVENPVEPDRDGAADDLVAPEALFPDEAAGSG